MLFSCRKYYKLVMVCERKNSSKVQLIYVRVVIYYINQDAMSPGCLLPSFQFTYILYNLYIFEGGSFWSVRQDRIPMHYALCRVQHIIFCWGIFLISPEKRSTRTGFRGAVEGATTNTSESLLLSPNFCFTGKKYKIVHIKDII